MPHTRSARPSTRQPRVPLGVFIATDTTGTGSHRPAWHGMAPADVAVLIRTYTDHGDLVVDLDAHPTITAAACYLHRVPATLTGTGDDEQLRLLPAPSDQPEPPTCDPDVGAGLVLAALPRPSLDAADRNGVAAALWRWRMLLRPGGHLIVVPAATGVPGGRAAIIAAAAEVGLRWQQHLLITVNPPEHEPEPSGSGIGARLLDGRHVPAHLTPLVFATAARSEVRDV
ncbi:MAG: hypothetical protein JXA67_19180 [Micromonosporaceae bacterium]|nr:hypothetical protein [Micromonosporaceae bacterium]